MWMIKTTIKSTMYELKPWHDKKMRCGYFHIKRLSPVSTEMTNSQNNISKYAYKNFTFHSSCPTYLSCNLTFEQIFISKQNYGHVIMKLWLWHLLRITFFHCSFLQGRVREQDIVFAQKWQTSFGGEKNFPWGLKWKV